VIDLSKDKNEPLVLDEKSKLPEIIQGSKVENILTPRSLVITESSDSKKIKAFSRYCQKLDKLFGLNLDIDRIISQPDTRRKISAPRDRFSLSDIIDDLENFVVNIPHCCWPSDEIEDLPDTVPNIQRQMRELLDLIKNNRTNSDRIPAIKEYIDNILGDLLFGDDENQWPFYHDIGRLFAFTSHYDFDLADGGYNFYPITFEGLAQMGQIVFLLNNPAAMSDLCACITDCFSSLESGACMHPGDYEHMADCCALTCWAGRADESIHNIARYMLRKESYEDYGPMLLGEIILEIGINTVLTGKFNGGKYLAQIAEYFYEDYELQNFYYQIRNNLDLISYNFLSKVGHNY